MATSLQRLYMDDVIIVCRTQLHLHNLDSYISLTGNHISLVYTRIQLTNTVTSGKSLATYHC